MKAKIVCAALLAVALTVSVPTAVLAGVAMDPNLGDEVLGTSGGLRYASDSMGVNGSGFASPEVGCGNPRWHLLGGGSAAGGLAALAFLSANRPLDFTDTDLLGDDGWLTGAYGPVGSQGTGYSVCIRDRVERYPVQTVANSSSGLRSATVSCPIGPWRITAGSMFIATSGSWIDASYPLDQGRWTGRVYDTGGGIGGFSAYAVCAKGLDLRTVRRAPVPVSAGESVIRRVDCNEREHVVSGGVRVGGPADRSRLVSTIPYDDADANTVPDDGWLSRVYNVAGAKKQVTAFAICLG